MSRKTRSSPQPILLGLLMAQAKHGYELHQELGRGLGGVWQVGLSRLYAQLKQLEEAGLVASSLEPQENRPARKVYRLTREGRSTFLDWVHQPSPYLRHIRVEFLARLFFFRKLGLPGLDQLVGEQKKVCRAQVDRFEKLVHTAEDDFRRLVLEFRIGQLQAVIGWLDRCLQLSSASGDPEQSYPMAGAES